MKIIITLFLTIMIGNNVFAQYGIKELPIYQNHKLVRLDYENKSGEKAFTNFEYNDEGYLIKAIWELTDNSRSGIISYKYDEKGNIIGKYRTFSDSITISQTFEYNPSSKLLKDNFARSDGAIGTTEYIYDKNGKLLKAVCNKLDGWFTGNITYDYDKNGDIIKGNLLQNKTAIGTINYFHNDKGLLIEEHWDFPNIWNQTFDYKYKQIN